MRIDPIQATDFYKVGHQSMYPEGLTELYSNFTPRSNRLAPKVNGQAISHVLNIGLSGFVSWFLVDAFNTHFFGVSKEQVIYRYNMLTNNGLGPDSVNADHIAALHDLGYLPLEILALPEGELVPMGVPILTIRNTMPGFGWLTNYLETVLSASLWKTITTASIAYAYREILTSYALETGAPLDFVLWQGHDFSMRGVGGVHDAASNGIGHLAVFLGTDTIPAIGYAQDYYDAGTFVGGSVPATEHSVASANIMKFERELQNQGFEGDVRLEAEKMFMRRYITEVVPSGIASYVSDTYDYWGVLTQVAPALKQEILDRKPNGLGIAKVVFRPDSGDPVKIVCGEDYPTVEVFAALEEVARELYCEEFEEGEDGGADEATYLIYCNEDNSFYNVTVNPYWNRYDKRFYYIDGWQESKIVKTELTPEQKGSVQVLWETFGGTVNERGYKVLNERVGLIYGDSITLDRATQILEGLKKKGFASSAVVFGIGSFTYQYNTRDTFGFAMKATSAVIDGDQIDLYKSPKTDGGTKKSAKGLLKVIRVDGEYKLIQGVTMEETYEGEMKLVFRDGFHVRTSFDSIRERVTRNILSGLDLS